MRLVYYRGKNFGDALNPVIFYELMPSFFDDNESELFLGIGSILGFKGPTMESQKVFVFSSGFAYGKLPCLDQRYEILCVRGPLTADALGISRDLAITDGAVLLRLLPDFMRSVEKKYNVSYVPHHISIPKILDAHHIFEELGIHLIDPTGNVHAVINEVRQSRLVLAEAMHAAIVADALRIPWLPVKMFRHVNEFKWMDWFLSLGMPYHPRKINSIYSSYSVKRFLSVRFGEHRAKGAGSALSAANLVFNRSLNERLVKSQLKQIMSAEPILSHDSVMDAKVNQLADSLKSLSGQKI